MKKRKTFELDNSLDFLWDSRYRQEKRAKKMQGQLIILVMLGLLVLIFV